MWGSIFLQKNVVPSYKTSRCHHQEDYNLKVKLPLILEHHFTTLRSVPYLRLPTVAARVRAQVSSCGNCGGQSGTGAGFLRVLRFPLQILIPPTAPHSSIIRGWYNRPVSGRRNKWIQSHPPTNFYETAARRFSTFYNLRLAVHAIGPP
jgi:hypothetical protein